VPHLPPSAIEQVQRLFNIKPGTALNYAERAVQRNGHAFDLYTPSGDPAIMEIALASIESQLNQAIGRARLPLYDCAVYVFGNFVPADYVEILNA